MRQIEPCHKNPLNCEKTCHLTGLSPPKQQQAGNQQQQLPILSM